MSFDCVLALEDGSYFFGEGIGARKLAVGEIVFNTSMSGYQEIITDPSYCKQIITFTHPHIGNTGINSQDNESNNIYAEGIVLRDYIDKPSNHRSEETLNNFLLRNGTIGIFGIDTRRLTSILREKGSLKASIYPMPDEGTISAKLRDAIAYANNFNGLNGMDLAKEVTTQKIYSWDEGVWPEYKSSDSKKNIVVYDYGI